MMYNNKLVVALKTDGKILREFKDTVYIPFGSEYSILIKNLNTVRAKVKISIDGEDISEDSWFVVDKNDEIEIERSFNNGNLKQGNKFKFIERTNSVEEYRGIKIEDGLIRVEFQFEKQPAETFPVYNIFYNTWPGVLPPTDINKYYQTFDSSQPLIRPAASGVDHSLRHEIRSCYNTSDHNTSGVGITVPGSISDQSINTTTPIVTDGISHTIILRIVGEVENEPVKKAVTTTSKVTCVSCGRKHKASSKFCANCGTSLHIL